MNDQQWEQLRAKAQKASDSVYETDVSKTGSLTQQDVDDVLKTSATNRSQFNELVSIVRDATKSNQEKAQSIRNVDGMSELVVSLLGKFLK